TPQVVGLHVGEMFPYISPSSMEGLSFTERCVQPVDQTVAHAIAVAAYEEKADVIVMSTNGRDTFSQRIVGSITERVLRESPCPVLAVAAE
ncbi:MAG: hypothetical protein GF418_05965, partial [Chitinivibrionales bacterium]|nr:hypothetical protein [Chitinivibrionales bacterium]MBD3395157.1 hypothetical protein [Chitinivibrionales bacterium]